MSNLFIYFSSFIFRHSFFLKSRRISSFLDVTRCGLEVSFFDIIWSIQFSRLFYILFLYYKIMRKPIVLQIIKNHKLMSRMLRSMLNFSTRVLDFLITCLITYNKGFIIHDRSQNCIFAILNIYLRLISVIVCWANW